MMSIFGLPLILFKVGIDMGDLEYIEGKVLAGDYFQVSGDISDLNDTIEYTVPNGKTAFLIEAKITTPAIYSIGTGTVQNSVRAEIKVDGDKIDESVIGVSSQTAGFANEDNANSIGYGFGDGRFNVLGISLIGDGIKKIEIENIQDNGTAIATMSGYLV